MKRFLTLILCAALLSSPAAVPVSAARVSAAEAIGTLETLGLVRGSGSGFEGERSATRAEAAVMLLRLLGREQAALDAGLTSPFSDAGWADRYLGYAHSEGLVRGVSASEYGSGSSVSARDYVTMVLRALGYTDGEDFTWKGSLVFADGLGLTHGEYASRPDAPFLREDMALVSYTALSLVPKDGRETLLAALLADGAVRREDVEATRFAGLVNAGKPTYSAAEIYERTSSCVVFTEMFASKEDMQAGNPLGTGSGFFITSDGIAVMSYHQLEGGELARATTTDGRMFDITGVLYYQPERDIAVVRISRTDSDGNSVRFFPTLTVGDSDAISAGDPIFTVSSPLGLMDSISDGLVANRSRILDDPQYPCIQLSAAISRGSSGGPLLNAYGEVIGVLYATFTSGQNLNLAVPLNCIRGLELSGAGRPLPEICAVENAKKAKAVLIPDTENVTVRVGQTAKVLISSDCPGHPQMRYTIADSGIISCAWGDFTTRQSVILKITGEAAGDTSVRVTFSEGYGNTEADAAIQVHVVE